MSIQISSPTSSSLPSKFGPKFLTIGQKVWLVSLMTAQLVFVVYLAAGYGFTGITQGLAEWKRFNSTAYVSNDALGNAMYAAHVLLAILMIIGGSLQLIPAIRSRFGKFHRYNGRLFVVLACCISLAGMYLIIVRGTVGDLFMHSLTSFSGLVVLFASFFAVKAARSKQFVLHQQWALHLFVAANSVLFFRLFIFAWMIGFGTLGINTADFTGPTVYAISVLSYVAPHLVLLALRYASGTKETWLKVTLGSLLLLTSGVFLLGLFALSVGNWYPLIVA